MTITRLVLGDGATSPLIPNQGREPNLSALFGAANPAVKLLLDAKNPFAHNYGVVPGANRGIIFWDELLKNETSLTGILLNYFSSGNVNIGGIEIETDILNIAASNRQDIRNLRDKDPESPLLDRKSEIPWDLLTLPEEIARVILMEIKDLESRQLGLNEETQDAYQFAHVSGADLRELVPDRKYKTRIQTPHRRQALRINKADGKHIYLSPLALEYMSYIISLTRMNFNPEKVKFGDKFPVVNGNDSSFVDRETRLRVLLGEKDMNPTLLKQLFEVMNLSGEGTFGISHRDQEKWWEKIIQEVQKESYQNTITPRLIHGHFEGFD